MEIELDQEKMPLAATYPFSIPKEGPEINYIFRDKLYNTTPMPPKKPQQNKKEPLG